MQGPGGPDEDRSGGFERGGWTTRYFDHEAATFLDEVYGRADAFLFGRRTYEIVAGHITVEPQQRESYLAGCVSIVERAREELAAWTSP